MKDKAIEWFEMLEAKMKDTEFESYLTNAIKALKAQKVGKWLVVETNKTRTLIHKECGFQSNPYVWENYNFCPRCGARMEAQKNER